MNRLESVGTKGKLFILKIFAEESPEVPGPVGFLSRRLYIYKKPVGALGDCITEV